MQNVYFNEIEAAYMRSRVWEAVHASDLAAQAIPPSITRRLPFMPNLIQAFRRTGSVIQRLWLVLQPIPGGKELPAIQG